MWFTLGDQEPLTEGRQDCGILGWATVAHAFNPRAKEAEAGGSV